MSLVETFVAEGLPGDLLEDAFVELAIAVGTTEMLRVELETQRRYTATGNGPLARMTEGAAHFVVVRLAERTSAVLEEGTPGEGLVALLQGDSARDTDTDTATPLSSHLTDEAVRMPGRAEGRDEVVLDWLLAAATLGRVQTEEVVATEGPSLLLVEAALPQLPSTLSADEVLGMEGLS